MQVAPVVTSALPSSLITGISTTIYAWVSYHHISLLKMIHLTMQYSLSRFLSLFNLPILLSFDLSRDLLKSQCHSIREKTHFSLFHSFTQTEQNSNHFSSFFFTEKRVELKKELTVHPLCWTVCYYS